NSSNSGVPVLGDGNHVAGVDVGECFYGVVVTLCFFLFGEAAGSPGAEHFVVEAPVCALPACLVREVGELLGNLAMDFDEIYRRLASLVRGVGVPQVVHAVVGEPVGTGVGVWVVGEDRFGDHMVESLFVPVG